MQFLRVFGRLIFHILLEILGQLLLISGKKRGRFSCRHLEDGAQLSPKAVQRGHFSQILELLLL